MRKDSRRHENLLLRLICSFVLDVFLIEDGVVGDVSQ